MSELEAQDTYVLLYECYNNESLYGGGDNVVLKFLPSKHPFAGLLLHEGSRQRKMKVAYELDLWRRSDPVIDWNDDVDTIFARSWPIKYCRQSVIWSSDYGRPLEAHLNLCRSVEVWLKAQPVAAFGRNDFPKHVVGMVRLDSDEHGYTDIAHEIRESQRYGALDANNIASDISTLGFHVCRYLKDTILSFSEEEVNEFLADFCRTQAHQQTSPIKSELLAHLEISC